MTFCDIYFQEPVLSKRLYLQKLNFKDSLYEYVVNCIPKEKDVIKFKKIIDNNPFTISAFKIVVPNLFFFEEKKKKVEDKDRVKTGLELLMERNASRVSGARKQDVTLDNYIISFVKNTEQDYSIVDRITYTYMNTITDELRVIAENKKNEEKNKKGVSIDKISSDLSGGSSKREVMKL